MLLWSLHAERNVDFDGIGSFECELIGRKASKSAHDRVMHLPGLLVASDLLQHVCIQETMQIGPRTNFDFNRTRTLCPFFCYEY